MGAIEDAGNGFAIATIRLVAVILALSMQLGVDMTTWAENQLRVSLICSTQVSHIHL